MKIRNFCFILTLILNLKWTGKSIQDNCLDDNKLYGPKNLISQPFKVTSKILII